MSAAAHHLTRSAPRGRSETDWLLSPQWDTVPARRPADLVAGPPGDRRVVVVAPHPDDETLAIGATLVDLRAAGVPVLMVLLTDGESSHPRSRTVTRDQMRTIRVAEADEAARTLGGVTVHRVGLPDGGVTVDATREVLAGLLRPGDVVLAPLPEDGHPDHEAAGEAARLAVDAAAEGAGVDRAQGDVDGASRLWFYPVWRWLRSDPAHFAWSDAVLIEPSLAALRTKSAALGHYRSQTHPLSPLPGDEAIVGPLELAPHCRVAETLLRAPATPLPPQSDDAAERLAGVGAMLTDSDDPWATRTSWYERRKREVVLSALAREHYGHVLDIGCSVGTQTFRLAERATRVTAVDATEPALQVARRAADEHPDRELAGRIEWVHGYAPAGLPDGRFDLVVISEVGYFLTPAELLGTLRHARRVVADGGEIVLVHWRHPSQDIPLDGPAVHEQARTALDLPLRVEVRDPDFLLDIYRTHDSLAKEAVS